MMLAYQELYLTIGGLGCALSEYPSLEVKTSECAGRVFGQAILAFHVLLVYILWVITLNQPHRGAFLRLELTARQLLDGDLNSEEVKMLVLLLLSTMVALLLQQTSTVAPASLWPRNIATQPPLLGSALTTGYAVLASSLGVVVLLEAIRPPMIAPMSYAADGSASHAQHDAGSDATKQSERASESKTQEGRKDSSQETRLNTRHLAQANGEVGGAKLSSSHSAADVAPQGEVAASTAQTDSFRVLPKRPSEPEELVLSSDARGGGTRNSERTDRGASLPEQVKKGGFLSKAKARKHVGVHDM